MILKTLGVIYHTSLYCPYYSPRIVKTRIDNFGIALIVISLLLSGCTAETDPEPIEGCMDELATNFDINADVDNGSCEYADPGFDCDGNVTCPEDVNNNGVIDVGDVLAVLGDFGCTSSCESDVNGDGVVTVVDILLLLSSFGQACP